MYIHKCDICGKVISNEAYGEYKVKKRRYLGPDSWWQKVDVCYKCEDEMALYLRDKVKKENKDV